MKRNTLFISLILLLIASMTAVKVSATPTPPVVSLNPMESTVQQGESFMINVTVANVTDLGAWEFKLDYNTTILDATYVSPTPDTANNTDWVPVDENGTFHPDGPPAVDDAMGRVRVGALIPVPQGQGLTGSFSLVTINFTATEAGKCALDLYDTVLGDSMGAAISHTTLDGSVTVYQHMPVISLNPTESTVQFGDSFTIDVNVADVTDLGAWEFKLDYNTTILDATYVSPTPDTANNTDWIPVDLETGIFHPDGPPAINDTLGQVWVGALVPAPLGGGLNGSFSLVTINFTATAAGNCTLDLYETVLGDSWGNLTGNTVINGSVTVIPDTTKPSISTPTQSPLEGQVQPNQTVTVSVEVTDGQSGVLEVVLSYKYSTDEGQTWTVWRDVTMSNPAGDTYVGEIPEVPAGTRVQYGINALDKAGNAATNNNAGSYYIYTVIPEFSSWIALILVIAITSLAVFLGSRKLNGKHQFRLSKTKDHH